jgi:hypothetical protein
MLGLDNMQNKMRAHIYPINKMYAIPEKKPVSNDQLHK